MRRTKMLVLLLASAGAVLEPVSAIGSSALAAAAGQEPDCPLEQAIYVNPPPAEGKLMGGYELIFRPDEYGAATVEAFTLSLPGYISFKGEVGSSLGISRQYAYIPHPCLGEPEWSAKCEEDKALDAIYHGEPYGLRVNSEGRITPEHLYGPDPAPPTILLPNLSAQMFGALRHFIPDFRAPGDMFYFKGCADTVPE